MENNRIIFSEDLRNIGDEELVIKLPINIGFYVFDDLDYQSSSIVEKNGDITLKFSHASDYLIVIEEAKTSDDKPSDDVPTSTTMSIALWGMCMLFAAGTMTLLKTRKQQ